jgi:TetR/AcrR family transcriptional repressor of bet genes
MDAHGSRRGSQVDKFGERRETLVGFAISVLLEQGYCRTSLRDIAQRSTYSHGVVHYYFADKLDLMTECLAFYQQRAEDQLQDVDTREGPAPALAARLGRDLAASVRDEWQIHRLWYDLRAQAMYQERLWDAVARVETARQALAGRMVGHYAELSGQRVLVDPVTACALIDGLVATAVMQRTRGGNTSLDWLAQALTELLPTLVTDR